MSNRLTFKEALVIIGAAFFALYACGLVVSKMARELEEVRQESHR